MLTYVTDLSPLGDGCTRGQTTPECNAAFFWDQKLLGTAHLYAQSFFFCVIGRTIVHFVSHCTFFFFQAPQVRATDVPAVAAVFGVQPTVLPRATSALVSRVCRAE